MRYLRAGCLSAALLIALVFNLAIAQPVRRASDDTIVRQATLLASGEHVDLYQDGIKADPAFLAVLESTYKGIEKLLGRPHDKATLGDKLRVYVSENAAVSHVWHGYEHQSDPRGILILNRSGYFGGVRGDAATYAHELTHLFTWRFYSHTLREGLADFIALQILPGAGVGPNAKGGYDWTGKLPPEVLALLGTTEPAPAWATNDVRLRQAYYFGSYQLVKALVEKGGLQKFMQLYARPDVEAAFVELYGATRESFVRETFPENAKL